MEEEAAETVGGTNPFIAFRITFYPTKADQVQKSNGRQRYALTKRETQGVRQTLDAVEVTLKEGCFRVTTPEGNCGIKTSLGIVGLDRAIQEGVATVRVF